jgi:hypothetical protein
MFLKLHDVDPASLDGLRAGEQIHLALVALSRAA